MANDRDVYWCDCCGVELFWAPVVDQQFIYCCVDCQTGLPCRCGERMEMEDERRQSGESSPLPAWTAM